MTYAAVGGSLLLAAVFGALTALTVRIWFAGGPPPFRPLGRYS